MVQGGPENDTGGSYVGKARPLLHTQYNIEDLPADDVKRIMANLPDDESKPVDAFALSQNDIRREVRVVLSQSNHTNQNIASGPWYPAERVF